MITDDAVSVEHGMILGTAIVLTYTTFGGMMSVAILDFIQMIVVISGLLYIGYLVSDMTGGVLPVIEKARATGKLDFSAA